MYVAIQMEMGENDVVVKKRELVEKPRILSLK